MKKDRSFPFKVVGAGLVADAAGWVALQMPLEQSHTAGWALLVGGTATAVTPGVIWLRRRSDSQSTVGRWAKTARKHDGLASGRDHRRVSSRRAMRKLARTMRPSYADLGRWDLWRTPVTEYATELARVAHRAIYSPCENVTMRVGGPRTGKTGEMICRVVDAPGAVVCTSTRTDIYEWTVASRARKGPIHMFNPSGLAGLSTTIKWSPLIGCRIPAIAQRRAEDMIPVSSSAEGERWDVQARRVLKFLMHAAALEGLQMRTVLGWVANPTAESAAAVHRALQKSPEAAALQMDARQFFSTNDRTKTSITATLMPVLAWLTDGHAAAVGDAPTEDDLLDVPTLIRECGTLYLLGAENGMVAPLIAALTAEIAHQARLIASGMPRQRLDPPLTIALDEAALICPVPLERWTADMGGYGITIHISLQSRAQLRARWGDHNAAVIINNSAVIMIYGGTRDPDDLQAWSLLCGERDEVVETTDPDGTVTSRTTRKVPVLGPSDIANLRKGHAVIVYRGMPPSLGKPRLGWERRDIVRVNKRHPYVPVPTTDFEAEVRAEQLEQGEGTTP